MDIDIFKLIRLWEQGISTLHFEEDSIDTIKKDSSSYNSKYYFSLLDECTNLADGRQLVITDSNTMADFLVEHPNISVCGIFQLGTLKSSFNSKRKLLSVFILSNEQTKVVKSGVYYWKTQLPEENEYLTFPESSFFPQFIEYIKKIENWLTLDISPTSDAKNYTFNEVAATIFEASYPCAFRYSKDARSIFDAIDKEKTVFLSDVADVVYSKSGLGNKKTLQKRYQRYMASFGIYSQAVLRSKNRFTTDTPLKKGDILISSSENGDAEIGFIDKVPDTPLFTTNLIIRSKDNISPYYLFIYLNSNAGKKLIQSYLYPGYRETPVGRLKQFPIVVPDLSNDMYENYYESFILRAKGLGTYDSFITKISTKEDKSILDYELIRQIKCFRDEEAKKLVEQDLLEVQKCLSAGAYKAVAILSGSILEAFLIDWLSAIHNKNYFEKPYLVFDNKTGRNKRADLIDYIDAIKYIHRPKWIKEAEKATKIRKTRNLVHAKLCLNSDVELNEEKCKEILQYLVDIINTRFNDSKP